MNECLSFFQHLLWFECKTLLTITLSLNLMFKDSLGWVVHAGRWVFPKLHLLYIRVLLLQHLSHFEHHVAVNINVNCVDFE